MDKATLTPIIYFFHSFDVWDLTIWSQTDQKFQSLLVSFQDAYVNDVKTIKTESLVIINDHDQHTIVDKIVKPTRLNLNTPYAMGDPHVMTIYNKKFDLPNCAGTYNFYNDGELGIIAKVDYYPHNQKYELYKDQFKCTSIGSNTWYEFQRTQMERSRSRIYIEHKNIRRIDKRICIT
jgi:hypothetical protein